MDDTLVVVHCYRGDQHLVEAFLPQFLHHGSPVLVLSPRDAPVQIDHPGVQCRSAGRAAYFGETSLARQKAHLKILLTYPQRFFLLNDADSMCLSPEIPAYLYEQSDGVVWSNEVRESRPHESPYPKIALHPPYFLTRESIEAMVAVSGKIKAHPITPFIDWFMLAMVCEAGLEHHSYPDGKSFPAWRHGAIPETKELGHDYVHVQENRGVDGAKRMRHFVARGAVMVHSVKHPPVRDLLVEAHTRYTSSRARTRRPPGRRSDASISSAKISALVAHRDDSPGQERTRLWEFIRAKLERDLPEVEVVLCSDDGVDPFHKTLALNRAASRATGDIFYVLDSDTWVPPDSVRAAANRIAAGPAWCKPWRTKLKLGAAATQGILALGTEWDGSVTSDQMRGMENRNSYQPAPPLLVSREAFETVGGMDERFRGWGSEDEAFASSLRAFFGRPDVLPGVAIHLNHPRIGRSGRDLWPGQTDAVSNHLLGVEYRKAVRLPERMRALIAARPERQEALSRT